MRQTQGRAVLIPLLAVLTMLAAGCGTDRDTPTTEAMLYEVSGEIVQLPHPAQPGTELQIRHEAIPTFVSAEGEIVGMQAMTMPFPVADGVSLEGLQLGDPVVFSLEVNWERSPAFLVTRLERVETPEVEALEPIGDPEDEIVDQPAEAEPEEGQHEH